MKTPNNDVNFLTTITSALNLLPSPRGATNGDVVLQRQNAEGHADLRIYIAYEGERQPHSIKVTKLDGRRSQIIQWESTLSAHMPSAALLAMLQAA